MRIRATITVSRRDIRALHEWLDEFAVGWAYQGFNLNELPPERTRTVVEKNNEYADHMNAHQTGYHSDTIKVVLPDEQAAMLCKLTWVNAEVEKPA